MTLIDAIEHEMQTDEDSREDQSARLFNIYEDANEAEKAKLDDALICICGYSFKSLIAKIDEEEAVQS